MPSLIFRRVLSSVVTLALALLPFLSYAAQPQDRVGVLMEFNWNVGDIHPDQSRWQANFALGSTGTIVRSMYETASLKSSVDDSSEYEYLAGYYQKRSLLPLQWTADSMGNSLGKLYGVPVVSKFSPVLNTSGTSMGSGSTIVSSPWVWVGAAVVGVAAAAGGGGGGGRNNSSEGQGCDIIGGNIGATDPDIFIVGEGCENNGAPISVES